MKAVAWRVSFEWCLLSLPSSRPGSLKRGMTSLMEESILKRSRTSSISSGSGVHAPRGTPGTTRNPIHSSYSSSLGLSQVTLARCVTVHISCTDEVKLLSFLSVFAFAVEETVSTQFSSVQPGIISLSDSRRNLKKTQVRLCWFPASTFSLLVQVLTVVSSPERTTDSLPAQRPQ